MTLAEYNQHVTRCAQLALGLHPGDKVAAKARLPGDHGRHARGHDRDHAADTLAVRANIADVAWCAHLADVRAKIDTLP
jgi:hypothetical protein